MVNERQEQTTGLSGGLVVVSREQQRPVSGDAVSRPLVTAAASAVGWAATRQKPRNTITLQHRPSTLLVQGQTGLKSGQGAPGSDTVCQQSGSRGEEREKASREREKPAYSLYKVLITAASKLINQCLHRYD